MCYSPESAAESLVLALSQYSDHDMGPGNAGKEMVGRSSNLVHHPYITSVYRYIL